MSRLKRPMYAAGHPKGPTFGFDVLCAKTAAHRYETGLLPRPVTGFTKHYGPALKEAIQIIQGAEGIPVSGNIGQATWDVLWRYLDAYHRWKYTAWKLPTIPKPNPVPPLGPIFEGEASLLTYPGGLTHNTDGITVRGSVWPALDGGWVAGRRVIAPEPMVITEQSGSAGGDAVFAQGASTLEYWIGHLAWAPPTRRSYRKGEVVGVVGAIPGADHCHWAVNARPLIGHDLLYGRTGHGPDYTPCPWTIGAQLREALSL